MKRVIILFTLLLFVVALQGAEKTFRIAVLTDLHVTPGNANDKKIDIAIDEINNDKLDLVVIDGDITNFGLDKELENVSKKLRRIRHRTLLTSGNHETTWSESGYSTFEKYFSRKDHDAFSIGDYAFISYAAGPYVKMGKQTIPLRTYSFIERSLEKYRNKKIIVATHYPLSKEVTNRGHLMELYQKYNVIFTINGHYHNMNLRNQNVCPSITCRALYVKRKDDFGYTLLELKGDSVSVYNKVLGEKKELFRKVHFKEDSFVSGLKGIPTERVAHPEDIQAECIINKGELIHGGVAVKDGIVYYGNDASEAVAFDAKEKRRLWTVKFKAPIYSTPTICEDRVVFGTLDKGIVALDAKTGKRLWKLEAYKRCCGVSTYADGYLYMGGQGMLIKIDPKKGEPVWTFRFADEGQVWGASAVCEDFVVFGAWDRNLYCINKLTGRKVWSWNNGRPSKFRAPGNVVPRISNGRVMIVAPDNKITVFNLTDGKVLYRTGERKVRESTGISEDGSLFLSKTMKGEGIAFDAGKDSFQEVWCTDLGWKYDHTPCPVLVSGNDAFFSSCDGEVAIVDIKTSERKAYATLGNSAVNAFSKDQNGDVYITLTEGSVFRIKRTK
ncbi:MAG: PQQ-binding-like beta-propeller repeat protein [Alistipes sp.]|nr:PQQ-binding-like beta-propeller repeat protein [Candidatus Alistipes equi]